MEIKEKVQAATINLGAIKALIDINTYINNQIQITNIESEQILNREATKESMIYATSKMSRLETLMELGVILNERINKIKDENDLL